MRIAKYLFLLLFLFCVGLSVFILTQSSEFEITERQIVPNSKIQTFNYIDDFYTWESWYKKFGESSKNIKIDSSKIQWLSSNVIKEKSFASDSIKLKINEENFKGNSIITLKAITPNSTEVTWKIKGQMDAKWKFFAFLNGGIKNLIQPKMKVSLQSLIAQLNDKFNQHSIITDGIVTKNSATYISIQDTVAIAQFDKTKEKLFEKLSEKLKLYHISKSDAPFVIFKTWNTENQETIFEACLPISTTDSIAKMIEAKNLKDFLAFKTTLKGSNSYRKKAWDNAQQTLKNSNHKQLLSNNSIEVYKKIDDKTPSNNITEIYLPVYYHEPRTQRRTTTDTTVQGEAPVEVLPETKNDSL